MSIPASVPAAPAARIRARVASGIVMPGHLVVQELGVAGRDERQHAEQQRDREAAAARSGAGTRRASSPPAPRRTAAGSSRGGRRRPACAPGGPTRSSVSAAVGSRAQAIVNVACWPMGEPAWSSPRLRRARISIRPIESTSQTPRAGGVVADPRRVAGEREDVPDAEGVRAQQLGLERHQVPVAGRDVDEALEVEVVLDPERDGHRAHAHARHRRVARRCTRSAPASRSSRAASIVRSMRTLRGGSISTEIT